LSLLGLYSFFVGTDQMASLAGVFFLIVVALLSTNKVFCNNSFSIVFCMFTFLFFSVPIAFYLVLGGDYIFGSGLVDLPYSQEQYREATPWAIFFLTFSWISIWLPLSFVKTVMRGKPSDSMSKVQILSILAVGVLTWLITASDRLEFAEVNMFAGTKEMGIFSILFFAHAYLMFSGLAMILKANEMNPPANGAVITLTALIFFIFLLLFTLEGSKGSILSITLLFLIYPISALISYQIEIILLPSVKLLLILAITSLPIYYFVSVFRDLPNSQLGNFDTFFTVASAFSFDTLGNVIVKVLYRFSMAGFDRFVLIFQSFGIGEYHLASSLDFFIYISKNLINLISPGTPFLEAYMPSSQLFPKIISNQIIVGSSTQSELMNSFNTQAFTIFGLFIILFGLMAPAFLFIYTLIFSFIFNGLNSYLGKLALIYFFSELLLCHGPEVVIFYSIQAYVSMYFLFWMSKLKFTLINSSSRKN
jgi:hypothetical protein